MLQLFQSIFGSGRNDTGPYPTELIERAIERALDGTDPRMRALSGYQKKLRTAAIRAVDHVIALVGGLAAPLELNGRSCGTDPELTAYFASPEHLHEVLERDPALHPWPAGLDAAGASRVVALLLMERHERQVFGPALEGEVLRQDVAQTVVNFAEHHLVDPAGAEEEVRRRLMRRAFDHLLALALARMAGANVERGELEKERALLRRKHAALAAGRWGFDPAGAGPAPDSQALQAQLEEIEGQLRAAGAGPGQLALHLDIVVEALEQAEKQLWLEREPLVVDRMGVKQAQASALAPEIGLAVLHNAAGRSLVARLVGIARSELPPARDRFRDAERYLG